MLNRSFAHCSRQFLKLDVYTKRRMLRAIYLHSRSMNAKKKVRRPSNPLFHAPFNSSRSSYYPGFGFQSRHGARPASFWFPGETESGVHTDSINHSTFGSAVRLAMPWLRHRPKWASSSALSCSSLDRCGRGRYGASGGRGMRG